MAYNTGNPIGSLDPRDAADNKENFDRFALSTVRTYTDRLGVARKTVNGTLQDYAAYNQRGTWTTATAYNVNDVWRDGAAGAFYLVLADYTSGASAAADIAGGNVIVHQPKDWVVPIETVSDLRAFEPSIANQQIELLGHTVAGIGGGIFYADFSDTTSPDDNGVTIVTAGGRRWKRRLSGHVTPQMFGAVMNGATTDHTSIQAAINTGLDVVFLGGTYAISSGISFNQSNVRYSAKAGFRLLLLSNSNINMSTLDSGVADVEFNGLIFDGNGSNQTGTVPEVSNNGMQIGNNVERISYKKCTFRNMGVQNTQPDNPNVPSTYAVGSGIQRGGSGLVANDFTFEDCVFENCYAGIALRGTGRNLTVKSTLFKHLRLNSVRTDSTTFTNIVITSCVDEDSRGFECWGDGLKFTKNKSLNSHRHGLSGGIKNCYVAGNEIIHTTSNLDSLYAIEIGLSENSRVIGNKIQGWDGAGGIQITDAAQSANNCVISENVLSDLETTSGGVVFSNEQTGCTVSNNILFNARGTAISLRGDYHTITGNIVRDDAPDLANAKTTHCLRMPVSANGGHTVTGNVFRLAGPYITTGFFYCMIGEFKNSTITANRMFGGRQNIYIGADNSLITDNVMTNAYRNIRFTSSNGCIFKDNIFDFTNSFSEGSLTGAAIHTARIASMSAAPTDGTWRAGDRVYSTSPSAGGRAGWICVSGGTPGTWNEFADIAP